MDISGFRFSLYLLAYDLVVDSVLGFSMIKELNGVVYVGGKNSLSAYKSEGENLIHIITKRYSWPASIMNGSGIAFPPPFRKWPMNFKNIDTSFIFDACLNWRQEHQNDSERTNFLDYHHFQYHTPSGDWVTMNYSCMTSFIKSVEELTNETLRVCGTFGSFPRAFSVNKDDLTFINFLDVNVMSCARYEDEPMATYKDSLNNSYIASGWGLYRPDKENPDVPENNSTMLYADWRLYRNLFTLPSSMAWVLSSDVNFIDVVRETDTHLYFFGHEINNQYGLNNQEDRHAWQSFMLRICKSDPGFKYVPNENRSHLTSITNPRYFTYRENEEDFPVALLQELTMNKSWYSETMHLPTKHFLNPLKMNFGCYIGRRPRAISDNHYWGETNVFYINKLADVVFDPQRKINIEIKNQNETFGCRNATHSQIPLIGVFNSPGLSDTQVKPVGALCQLQINSNMFHETGSITKPYHKYNLLNVKNAYEEIMALSSTTVSNFYSRTIHRLNGFSLDPYWNQGVLIGKRDESFISWLDEVGKCYNSSLYSQISTNKFLHFQNFSNTAWPNELPNRVTSMTSAICQYSAVELYTFNATFLVPGEEFKKIFILQDNYTNYHMNKLSNEDGEQRLKRLQNSPLMIAAILSNSGTLYRVVLCDFDSAMEIHGNIKNENEWYNWCIFRHTDQPYLYRNYEPMEKKAYGESYQYRASSLLMEQKVVKKESLKFPNNRDPHLDIVKDVLKQKNMLHIVTADDIYSINLQIQCPSYHKCIDCASDPICMWDVSTASCINYHKDKLQDSLFIQDVLDRGFQCITAIKPKYQTLPSSDIIFLNCSNIDFWRDDIKWTMNGKEIITGSDREIHMFRDKAMILISNYSVDRHGHEIACYGVWSDHDKLFGGMEYSWIKSSSEMLLNSYEIIPKIKKNKRSPWEGVSIFFIIVSICMCIGIIIQFFKLKKINKVFQSKPNINEMQNNSLKSASRNDSDLKMLPNKKDGLEWI